MAEPPEDAQFISSRWASLDFSQKKASDGNVKAVKACLFICAIKMLPFLTQHGPPMLLSTQC